MISFLLCNMLFFATMSFASQEVSSSLDFYSDSFSSALSYDFDNDSFFDTTSSDYVDCKKNKCLSDSGKVGLGCGIISGTAVLGGSAVLAVSSYPTYSFAIASLFLSSSTFLCSAFSAKYMYKQCSKKKKREVSSVEDV